MSTISFNKNVDASSTKLSLDAIGLAGRTSSCATSGGTGLNGLRDDLSEEQSRTFDVAADAFGESMGATALASIVVLARVRAGEKDDGGLNV